MIRLNNIYNIQIIIYLIIIIILAPAILAPAFDCHFSIDESVIYVDDDNINGPWDGTRESPYRYIQDGIDAVEVNGIVHVQNGVYYETITIDKKIGLFGENKEKTIINGNNSDSSFSVCLDAENIKIKNFSITGGGFDGDKGKNFFHAGIRVIQSNNTIENNIIENNRLGILGVRVTNISIINNIFVNDGITFSPYENDGRPMIKPEYFSHNIFGNTVNGFPLYYFKNIDNKTISELNVGQIILFNCSELTVKDMVINKTDMGLQMAFCSNCIVENMSLSETDGLWLLKSDNNIIKNNNFSNNILNGITVDYQSNYNIIRDNYITSNRFVGIIIEWYSRENLIKNNILINNGDDDNGLLLQAFNNHWESNYWDDWIGLKSPLFSFFPKIICGYPIEEIPLFSIPLAMDRSPLSYF